MKSETSIARFEPASFSGPVQIQKICNAIPTRPVGTWKGIDVKYTWTLHGLGTFLYHSKKFVFLSSSGSRLHNFSHKTYWTETCFSRLCSLYNGDLTHSIRKIALKSQTSCYFVHFCVSFMSMIIFRFWFFSIEFQF